jgi:PadR family transcriptional regulator PadR
MPSTPVSVLKGTLDLLVLRTLGGGEEMHGFEILDWITDATGGSLALEEGALYPALHRLEKKGWLRGEWGVSEKGRRAKYYGITGKGRRALGQEEAEWARYVDVMSQVAAAGGSKA